MKRFTAFLSHTCFVLSLVLLTLLIVDRFNPSMDFINNDFSKLFLAVLCMVAALLGILVLIQQSRSNR
ncbi:MAG: hypothetical protein IKB04_02810 [Clostridia bacterium]|nr:hypothetical protein [Clostridia bacterium]